MSAPAPVQVERDGRVMTVRLVNPPHNFMNRAMVVALDDLITGLEDDPDIGAVIITGGVEGKFITHYDVAEIHAGTETLGRQVDPRLAAATLAATGTLGRVPAAASMLKRTPASGLVELREIHDLFLRMNRLDKVFIAAIGGPAMGGGCELALACDLRLIAEGAGPIGLPEVTIGLQPGAGGTQRMAHTVGSARAIELILEGAGLTPAEAEAAGLVNRVVEADDLLEQARALARRMARRSPLSITGVKRSIYDGASAPLAAGLAEERRRFLAVGSSAAAARGMAAYVEQVEADDAAPAADSARAKAWQDGTAVDLTGDSGA